jgi:hypothetical protein
VHLGRCGPVDDAIDRGISRIAVVPKAIPDRSGSKCFSAYQQRQAILHFCFSELKYIPLDCAHAIVPEWRQIDSCEAVEEWFDPCGSELCSVSRFVAARAASLSKSDW